MNKIKSVFLTSALLCMMPSVSKADLTDIMQKYCVPKSASNCSNAFTAKYNGSRNTCECENNTYMRYDAGERHCVIQCPAGAIAVPVSACPAGSWQMMIVNHS